MTDILLESFSKNALAINSRWNAFFLTDEYASRIQHAKDCIEITPEGVLRLPTGDGLFIEARPKGKGSSLYVAYDEYGIPSGSQSSNLSSLMHSMANDFVYRGFLKENLWPYAFEEREREMQVASPRQGAKLTP